MKLAIAAFGTALVLASGASAMVGPYERAIDAQLAAGALMSGMQEVIDVADYPAGPNVDWSADGKKAVTVFEAGATGTQVPGYAGR